jgi:hypothetical protein
MPRKKSDIHYLYKTTCKVTGRYYIGMHSTNNLEDGYLGSGLVLRRSIRKHGKDNHEKEILELFESRELLVEAEKAAITDDMLVDRNCMNLVSGGNGWNKLHNQAFKNKLLTDTNFKNSFSLKKREDTKKAIVDGKINPWKVGLTYDWTNKHHSESTKMLMSDLKKGTGLGKNNSQYGTIWITKDNMNKKIKKEDLEKWLSENWVKGKYTSFNGESIKTSKLKESDVKKIKNLLYTNITQSEIALMFNVKQETISKIKRGLIWVNI